MAGNFVTTATKDLFEAVKSSSDMLAPHSPELATPELPQDPDAFAQLMQHYEAPPISISALQGNGGAKGGSHNPLTDLLSSAKKVTEQLEATIQNLKKAGSLKELVEIQYSISKTSAMMNLFGNFIGKSVQHCETLLRMQ